MVHRQARETLANPVELSAFGTSDLATAGQIPGIAFVPALSVSGFRHVRMVSLRSTISWPVMK